MRSIYVSILVAAMAVAGARADAAPATSANPGYIGTWSADPANCRVPQDRQGAPMVLRRNRYDQHEAHCAFKSVRRSSNAWWVSAQCVVEGAKQPDRFTLRLKGDTLVMAHGKNAINLKRCR